MIWAVRIDDHKILTVKTEKKVEKINCFNCSHFFITYDPHEPYGCRAMGFKSRQFPSDVAESCSGLKCQMYTPKKKRQNEDEAL